MTIFLIVAAWAAIGLAGYGLGWIDGRHDLRKEYAAVGQTLKRHEKHEVKKSAN